MHNRWTALRSFHPANNAWSCPLFLYLNDPVLITPSSPPAQQASADPSLRSATAVSGIELPRDGGGGGGARAGGVGGRASISGTPPMPAVEHDSSSSGWLSSLSSPAWYLVGKIESVSSSVARVFVAPSSSTAPGEEHGGGTAAPVIIASAIGGRPGGREGAEQEGEMGDKGTGQGKDGRGNSWWGEGTSRSSSVSESSSENAEEPRRLFLEFYGPVVGVFAALGFPAWLAEFSTVVAAQLCPLLAAMPLLRLSSRGVGEGHSSESAGEFFFGRLSVSIFLRQTRDGRFFFFFFLSFFFVRFPAQGGQTDWTDRLERHSTDR